MDRSKAKKNSKRKNIWSNIQTPNHHITDFQENFKKSLLK